MSRQQSGVGRSSPYRDYTLSVKERVDDLISRMTLEEKIAQMVYDAPAIERLDIPAYNWWNECLHGVGRAGVVTVCGTWHRTSCRHASNCRVSAGFTS